MPLVCFASPKGGVGKTLLTANVAAELCRLGARVVALDADPQDSLGLHFGLGLFESHGFVAALRRDSDPKAWRSYVWNTACGVGLLPDGRVGLDDALTHAAELVRDPGILTAPLRDMLSDPTLIVVADLPPGTSGALAALAPLSDLMVTTLLVDAMSLAQIPLIESGRFYGAATANALAADRLAYVLNQFDPRTRLGRACYEAAVRHFQHRLVGVLYRDENIPEAVAAQQLICDYVPHSRGAHDVGVIARAIAARLAPSRTAAAALFNGREVA